jgi:hypothetical protein
MVYTFLQQTPTNPPLKLLPQFYKCDRLMTTESWAEGLTYELWEARLPGLVGMPEMEAPICNQVADWIITQLDSLTTATAPLLRDMGRGKCYRVSKAQLRGRAHVLGGEYVKIPIGMTRDGKVVLEGVHRLACWLKSIYNPLYNVAMHTNGCGHKWCINPHHLKWGDILKNTREHLQRHRRGGGS